jgi:hypothetical protein
MATLGSTLVGLGAFTAALLEYRRTNTLRRAEFFYKIHDRLYNDKLYNRICKMIVEDSDKLASISITDKINFTGLFDEISLLVNSNLLDIRIVDNLFGFYIFECWNNNSFWVGLDRDDNQYHGLLKSLVIRLENIESGGRTDKTRLCF